MTNMDILSAALFLMLLAVALSPFFLIFQLTRLAHSSYRNRLWVLRDRITDDLRMGVIERSTTAETIRRIIERQIQVVGRHTLADSLLAISIFDVDGETSVFEEILRDDAPQQDKNRLMGYLRDFSVATVKHLIWGSVFGWIAYPLVRGLKFVATILQAMRLRRSSSNGIGDQSRMESGSSPSLSQVPPKPGMGVERSKGDDGRVRPGGRRRQKVLVADVEQAAQEIRQKLERAEVEIMPTAAPSRQARIATKQHAMAGADR